MGSNTQQIRCVCHLSSASFPLRIPCLNTPTAVQFGSVHASTSHRSSVAPLSCFDFLLCSIHPLNPYTEKNQFDFEQTGCDQTVIFLSMTTAGAETGIGAMCRVKINMKFGLCSENRI